jgi:cytochrome P450
MAGPDTVSNLLGFMLQYLIRFEKVQQNVRQEIDDVIGKSTTPTLDDLDRFNYKLYKID